jgi:hypothetical protein
MVKTKKVWPDKSPSGPHTFRKHLIIRILLKQFEHRIVPLPAAVNPFAFFNFFSLPYPL